MRRDKKGQLAIDFSSEITLWIIVIIVITFFVVTGIIMKYFVK